MAKLDIQYEPLILEELTEANVMKPVLHKQKGDSEYGLITGFDSTYVYVHFAGGITDLCLSPKYLFLIKKKQGELKTLKSKHIKNQ